MYCRQIVVDEGRSSGGAECTGRSMLEVHGRTNMRSHLYWCITPS